MNKCLIFSLSRVQKKKTKMKKGNEQRKNGADKMNLALVDDVIFQEYDAIVAGNVSEHLGSSRCTNA